MRKKPTGHSKQPWPNFPAPHSLHLDCPDSKVYEPFRQSWHVRFLAISGEDLPSRQFLHFVCCNSLWYLPGIQDVHVVAARDGWNFPSGHAWHVRFLAISVDDRPTAHSTQRVPPARVLYLPGVHGKQKAEPLIFCTDPMLQFKQVWDPLAPMAIENFPSSQLLHVISELWPASSMVYLPVSQLMHNDSFVTPVSEDHLPWGHPTHGTTLSTEATPLESEKRPVAHTLQPVCSDTAWRTSPHFPFGHKVQAIKGGNGGVCCPSSHLKQSSKSRSLV